mgnify:CR=1 FL=1
MSDVTSAPQKQALTFDLTAEEVRRVLFLLQEHDESALARRWVKSVRAQSDIPIENKPMSYSQFSLEAVLRTFALEVAGAPLFPEVAPSPCSERFRNVLDNNTFIPARSEKSRSETIVAPLIVELGQLEGECFSVLSGERMDVSPEQGLVGECDYIFTAYSSHQVMLHPVFALVEAKKNDIEIGLGQCAAQMVGARQRNQTHSRPLKTIYGCVTTGEIWQFVKLEGSVLTVDTQKYYLPEIDKILGIFRYVIRQAASEA